MSSDIKDSLADLKKYIRQNNFKKQVVELNYLGNLCLEKEKIDDARSYYRRAIDLSDKLKEGDADIVRSFRALAEIAANNDDSRDAILLALREYQAAARISNHSQIQLSYHVSAWIYEKLCTRLLSSDVDADYKKAASLCNKSIDFLRKYQKEIDEDEDEVKNGGKYEKRLAKIKRLYSSICVNSKQMDLALKLWKDAELMASKANDKEILYELWLTKLDFASNPMDYLRAAQQLANRAPPKKKADAMMELSMAKFYNDDFYGSFNELFRLFADSKLMKTLSSEDQDIVHDRIVRLYNLKELIAETGRPKCTKERRRKIYELIGDETSNFGLDWKTLSLGMLYYSYMLKFSVSPSEKKSATESLAVTSLEFAKDRETKDAWETAYDYNKKLYDCTGELRTKCEMFDIECKGRLRTPEELKTNFEQLDKEVPESADKGVVYGAYGHFLSSINSIEADVYLKKEKEIMSIYREGPANEVNEDVDDGELDPATRAAILDKLRTRSNYKVQMDKFRKQCNKPINKDGETHLHEAAQHNDQNHLKNLLDMGYDPNMKDNSGFTALSEAVIHCVVPNARVLLMKKAKVDVQSKQGLYDDDSESGWVTPLMEACHTGNVDMIKLLLQFNASVVLANDDKWTAVDFLRDYRNSRAGEEEIPAIDDLLAEMEELQKNAGHRVRKGPPPPWLKRVRKTFQAANKRRRRSFGNEHKENLDEYQRTIDGLGSRVPRGDCREDEEGESHPDVGYEDDLMSDGEPYCSRPSSRQMNQTTSRRGSFDHGTGDLPEVTGLSSIRADNSNEDIQIIESLPLSPAPIRRALDSDFIVNDCPTSKKRRNVSQRDDHKRRRSDTHYKRIFSDVADLPLSEAPVNVVLGNRPSGRRSRCVISDDEDNNISASTSYTPPASSMHYSPDVPSTINIVVHCVDDNKKAFRGLKMDSLPRDSTIQAIRKLYEQRLEVHQRQFDLFQDEIELDDTIIVSSLSSTNGRYVIHLVLKPVTPLSIYQANSASSAHAHLVELLDNLKISKNMDLSSVECDSDLTLLLKAVDESKTEVCELKLDKCHVKEEAYKYMCSIIPKTSTISLKSTGIGSQFISFASMNCKSNFAVTVMDLSYTDLMCGKSVASILKLSPLLKELILRSVEINQGASDLVSAICSIPKLQKIDLCCCDWLETDGVNSILNECTKITSLLLTGVDLSMVEFGPLVLPECRRLSLSATGFTNWASLCSWLADVKTNVEWIDLSCCDSLEYKEVEAIINSRSEFDKILTLRIVRCEYLLRDFRPVFKRLEDIICYRKFKRSSTLSPVVLEVSGDVYVQVKGQEPNALLYVKLA